MGAPVALTVCCDRPDARLSPFFALAPWLMVVDPARDDPAWLRNSGGSVAHVVGLIRCQAPSLVICGHVPGDAALALVEAGIELRIGPCSVPASSLIPVAARLPKPVVTPLR